MLENRAFETLFYLWVNSFQTGSLKAAENTSVVGSRGWFVLPLQATHSKDHAADHVLAGYRGISEIAVESKHQNLQTLF